MLNIVNKSFDCFIGQGVFSQIRASMQWLVHLRQIHRLERDENNSRLRWTLDYGAFNLNSLARHPMEHSDSLLESRSYLGGRKAQNSTTSVEITALFGVQRTFFLTVGRRHHLFDGRNLLLLILLFDPHLRQIDFSSCRPW